MNPGKIAILILAFSSLILNLKRVGVFKSAEEKASETYEDDVKVYIKNDGKLSDTCCLIDRLVRVDVTNERQYKAKRYYLFLTLNNNISLVPIPRLGKKPLPFMLLSSQITSYSIYDNKGNILNSSDNMIGLENIKYIQLKYNIEESMYSISLYFSNKLFDVSFNQYVSNICTLPY